MEKRKLVCKNCWIDVIPIGDHKKIGKGKDYEYRHKSFKDDTGQPYCGKVKLSDEDVEYTSVVEEMPF